jgi:predicted membrane channel-forming protein YqfA (hemolysin III family)
LKPNYLDRIKVERRNSLKKKVRIGLIICSAVLGFLAVVLSIIVWQSTPFFNMNLVFFDVIIVVLAAVLYAIAVMSPSD